MQAKDIMTTPVISVSDTSTVQEVAAILLDRRISAVPVVDSSGNVVGIVSEGDLMHRAEAGTGRHRSWWLSLFADKQTLAREFVKEHSRKASDVMTRNVITAAPEAELSAIATLLEKNRIKRVPIIENGRLVGIVSRANLLHAMAALHSESKAAASVVSDSTIREAILARLKEEPWSPSWVNVTVQNGVVDIWGMASSEAEKEAARVAAEVTRGVVAVKDNIVLRPVTYES
jgi:CBS domain-containing protein